MNSNKFGIILQARTSSTRLPNKIIKKIDGEISFLDILLERLLILEEEIPLILATTTNENDHILKQYGSKYNIPVFLGSEHNVLDRFIECATKYNIENIVRICSDNPFMDLNSISELLQNYNGEDYLSFKVNARPSILTHNGFFPELVSLRALKKISQNKNASCIEHVTNCIYSSQGKFNVNFIEKEVPNSIRCTLDTKGDFENLKFIYFNWYKKQRKNKFNFKELIQFIEINGNLLSQMKKEIKNNSK